MDISCELKYHELEENTWWFVSRRNIILKLIKKLNLKKDAKILDIGCSGGPLIKLLSQNGFIEVYGIDISSEAIGLCKERGIENVAVMDGTKTQFNDNEFDLIISSDTLEHIENDIDALSEWRRILKPNGSLIIFVPVFNFLWSSHDEIFQHFRRYSKPAFLEKLKNSGFKIIRNSYWNFCLFFPTSLMRILQRLHFLKKSKGSLLYKLNPWLDRCLVILLSIENNFLDFFNFPVGASIFAVCKTKERPLSSFVQ